MPNPGGTQNHRPYGSNIEGEADDIGYTGHKFDTDLGLSYMQARYYDPVIGRFYSNDPVGFDSVHNFNRYTYANNNPYKYIDPDGKDAVAIQVDLDLVGAPIFNALVPTGGGLSGGVVVQFEPRIPSFSDVFNAVAESPFSPGTAILDSFLNVEGVGLIGSYRGSAGFDISLGVAFEYTFGSASDFGGTSTQLEIGQGPGSISGSFFDTAQGTGIPSCKGAGGFELGVSPLPASFSVSREVTGIYRVFGRLDSKKLAEE
ncbi:RHS repeat-associated core domain-containing protein [Aestuariibacter sp. AA17]|uniref:RHS repeat-associated core domain-containing protein n=1 Tax=Fluctibacter corallii TaxID=2984329 RepID=A0ABT3ACW5_9ALTE|nr:RHS repeat-associated core domain-containing protein [Aestuariibacter sp. AA17]